MKISLIYATGALLSLPAIAKLPANVAPQNPPSGLKVADWTQIRAEYERHRHGAYRDGNGLVARSFGQQWLAHFDGRGFLVKPDKGVWNWGLELAGVSGAARVRTDVNRVTYNWSVDLDEWFVNDTRGLEHGFTVRAPHDIRLAIRGGLHARQSGDGVEFLDDAGISRIRYAGLKAWDANGRMLSSKMTVEGAGLAIKVDDRGALYPITIDPIAQQAYVKASNAGINDSFGFSAALSGDTAVVAAPNESSSATGVNGNQADDSAPQSGAVYVFVRNGATWSQQAYLKASNTGSGDAFGISVAIAGDTIAIGAYLEDSGATGVNGNQLDNSATNAGAAYVFLRSGTTWTQQAYLKASNSGFTDGFGVSVGVSGDTVVVGSPREASAATGVDGNQADNSKGDSGAAYVFLRTGTTWAQQAYLKASNTRVADFFGYSVAVSSDTVLIGSKNEGSGATGVNGNQADTSAFGSGAAYVFVRSGAAWSQQAYLKASNTGGGDAFGTSVALSGDTAVVGAYGEDSGAVGVGGNQADNSAQQSGAAYVFVRTGVNWTQQAYLKASNTGPGDLFGTSVAISGDAIAVGAYEEDSGAIGVGGNQADNSLLDSGSVYVYTRTSGVWSQQAYLKGSNTSSNDGFGLSVAVSRDHVLVGGSGEDSSAVGVNGNQLDNGAQESGAAFIFNSLLTMNVDQTGPLAVSGATQTLVFKYTHSGGFAQLGVVNGLINQYLNGDSACYIAFSQPLNVLYLVNDQGPGSGISVGLTLGSTGSVSNSQCTINSAGSSAVGNGNTLTLTVNVTYKTPFLGNKVIYLAAQDQLGNSTGWNTVGATIVPESAPTFPRSGTMSPSTGATSTATISFTYLDTNSAANLQTSWALINNAIDGRQACYVAYYAPGNTLYLYPDNGDGTAATSIVLAGSNTIENSHCRISALGSSVATVGNQLTLTLNYTFKSPFFGYRAVWTATQTLNAAQTSPWKPVGSWQVP